MKKTLIRARSRIPCKVSVGIASKSEMACRWVKDGVEFFCTPGALTAAMSWAVSQDDEPLGRKLLVGAAEDREPPCHRGGLPAGFQERPLVELHVVGRDLQRSHPLGLHVPQEVHEVAAVGLDRWFESSASQIQGTRAPAVSGRRCRWPRGAGPGTPRPWRRPGRRLPGSRSARAGAGCGGAAPLGVRRREGRECGLVEGFSNSSQQ